MTEPSSPSAPPAAKESRDTLATRLQRHFDGLLRRVPTGSDGVARVGARQIYILPTRVGLMYGSVLLVMLLGSLNYQNNLGLLFTFFLASVGLVAMHHAWFNLLGVAVQARGGPAVFAGETATFEIALRAERQRHDLRLSGGRERTPPQCVPAGDQTRVALGLPATRRGWCRIPRLTLETGHPMGLFRAWCYIATDAATLVYPRPATQAPPPELDSGDGRQPRNRRREEAEDYLGSRGYRSGDSIRHIDWKAFARERGLQVKQYGGAEGQELWIDWSRLGTPDPEVRLGLLTRQVLDASAAGARFGLRLPGATVGLAQGAAHTQDCLTRLALFGHAQD